MNTGDTMDIKKTAFNIAKSKMKETKKGKKMIKVAKTGGFLLGGSLVTYMLASYGKSLTEKER